MNNRSKFKYFAILIFCISASLSKAQKVDKMLVNLYTDSLKKGTYNYINIDGQMTDGSYMPLDSSDIAFASSDGKFVGNTLYLPADFKKEFIKIKATLRSDPAQCAEFIMYIKKAPDPENLKTVDELINDMKKPPASSVRKRKS